MKAPEVRFTDKSGVAIAWAQFGEGPDLLVVPALVSKIDLVWEHPFCREPLEYLARHFRVTLFDKRGVGSSERVSYVPTLEQRMADMVSVVDAAGIEQTVVLGVSEGGLSAQLFTTMHPERVARLAIINSAPGAAGIVAALTAADGSRAAFDQLVTRTEQLIATWGRDPQFLVDWFTPEHSGDTSWLRWMGRLQRESATAEEVTRQLDSVQPLDAAARLGAITVPTLVMHARRDEVMPYAGGRYLADRIPNSTFVELPHADHLALPHPDWRSTLDRFLAFATEPGA